MWKVMGQHLFVDIISNNFTAKSGHIVWCDQGMRPYIVIMIKSPLRIQRKGPCLMSFSGILYQIPNVSKSNGLHVVIFWFFFVSLRYAPLIVLNQSTNFPNSWTSTGSYITTPMLYLVSQNSFVLLNTKRRVIDTKCEPNDLSFLAKKNSHYRFTITML